MCEPAAPYLEVPLLAASHVRELRCLLLHYRHKHSATWHTATPRGDWESPPAAKEHYPPAHMARPALFYEPYTLTRGIWKHTKVPEPCLTCRAGHQSKDAHAGPGLLNTVLSKTFIIPAMLPAPLPRPRQVIIRRSYDRTQLPSRLRAGAPAVLSKYVAIPVPAPLHSCPFIPRPYHGVAYGATAVRSFLQSSIMKTIGECKNLYIRRRGMFLTQFHLARGVCVCVRVNAN